MISVLNELRRFSTSLSKIHKTPIKVVRPEVTKKHILTLQKVISKYVDRTVDRGFGLRRRQKAFARSYLPSYTKRIV